ncbi:hypothetical protein [Blastopirellula marina]|uniref:Uncharacterized protein n=1 Tax=Blastopirellula marina TaxID=124 RepID=A0A2S8F2Z9_9BACT|nr:hypothetical protein [Blastopirellula marina]PQO26529.1 hypothetical protein C5Y98_29490 [Blastopirellula marina]PTL40840.1 hypothetical protein C5Y97_29505 [Blastopirellula marina]
MNKFASGPVQSGRLERVEDTPCRVVAPGPGVQKNAGGPVRWRGILSLRDPPGVRQTGRATHFFGSVRFPLSAFRFPLSAFRFPLSAFRRPNSLAGAAG